MCSFLGIGECDGRQLMRQLNLYGFSEDELRPAIAWADQQRAPSPLPPRPSHQMN